jgi:phage/plasmid-associated DNA primase
MKTSESFLTRNDVVFDNKPFLLGFNNGVLDLKKLCEKEDGNFIYHYVHCFRPYKFDDYMTLTTGYDFEEFVEKENQDVVTDLVNFFNSIMPNMDHQLLLLQILASGLDGLLYQKFFMLNGEGGNGKGSIFELMKTLLGGYYKQGKNAVLNEMGKANGSSEDIMDLKGKRFIVFEELGEIDNDEIKRLTGGGETTGSRKYGSNETFKLQSTIVASFNEPATLKKKPTGNSELRRLIDLFFCKNFTSDPSKVGETYIKNKVEVEWCLGDKKFETDEWRENVKSGFLHMLLNVYRTFCDGAKGVDFTVPADVMRRTEDFLDAQNIFGSIFGEFYEKVEDKKQTVYVSEIWNWVSTSDSYKTLHYKQKKTYNRKYFDEWLEKKVGKDFGLDNHGTKIIKGYKFIDNTSSMINYSLTGIVDEEEEFIDEEV